MATADNPSFQKLNFFDEISANKRNSLVLLIFMFFLYFGIIWVLSSIFDFEDFGIFIGLIILIAYFLFAYFMGSNFVLGISNAKKVNEEDYPYLFLTIQGLCAANGIQMPVVYIIEDPAPNAFVVGRDPTHSSLVVTRGLLQIMNKDELAGVLAHEISHIVTYDIRFMLLAIVFAGAIAIVSDITWRSLGFGIFSSGRDKKGGNGLLIIIAIILAVLAPIFAELIRLAISRRREYLADANGARMTRQPQNLASALEKIQKINQPVAAATDSTAPLYFSNPTSSFFHLFSTHPPIEDRIKKLNEMN